MGSDDCYQATVTIGQGSQNTVFLMAKTRRQRLSRNKDAYPGCLAGFVSVFDFRQGRSARHLISDHRQKNVGLPVALSGKLQDNLHDKGK